MSVDQITSMNAEQIESNLDNIYEKMKQPEIQIMVENKIQSITEKIPEFQGKTPKEIYEKFWGKYSETPEELAKVFSYVFRKLRDGIEITDHFIQIHLQNSTSTLSIHQDGDIDNIIGSLNHGVTIKSLEEKIEKNGISFIKVEFFGNNGNIKTGYIAENFTKNVDSNSLKQLNGYIRSIGLNPTKQLKKDTFQKVYFLKDYNENKTRDNNEVYHKLVQDYELRRLIELEQCRLACLAKLEETKEENIQPNIQENITHKTIQEKKKLSDELNNNFINRYIPDFLQKTDNIQQDEIQIPFRPIEQIQTEKQEENIVINKENLPEFKNESHKEPKENIKIEEEVSHQKSIENSINSSQFVFNKIKNNPNIIFYLENKYHNNNFEENLEKFQKSIGLSGKDFKSLVMAYTYLFQHSFNNGNSIQLGEYYKHISGKNWSDLTDIDRNNLFKKYAGEVNEIYSGKKMSNNLTILRGLIIEHELGKKVENKITEEKLKPLDIYKKIGLSPSDLRYFNITDKERRTKNFMCSQKVADQLTQDGFHAIRNHSDLLFKKGPEKFGINMLIQKLTNEALENKFNVFDLAIKYRKDNGSIGYHRTIAKLMKNGEIFTKDNYHQGFAQNISEFPLNKKNAQYVIVSMHKQKNNS